MARKSKILPVAGVLLVIGAMAAGVTAPSGTTTTEEAAPSTSAEVAAPTAATLPAVSADDWPGYNKTLKRERYSSLSQVNTTNVSRLIILCTYDTRIRRLAARSAGV